MLALIIYLFIYGLIYLCNKLLTFKQGLFLKIYSIKSIKQKAHLLHMHKNSQKIEI